jgi:peptide-methionine (S)-S-oxide reductase
MGYTIMKISILALILCFAYGSMAQQSDTKKTSAMKNGFVLATFGSGCFWCTEAVFQRVKGVEKVVSGYMGGRTKNPTYKDVTSGTTGHAEVIQLTYNPSVVTYDELLEIFWGTHDPTTLNRQGADVGTQYRSVIFFHSEDQKKVAESYKRKLGDSRAFDNAIVTEISPAVEFYVAEDYHQNYFNLNSNVPYCSYVIQPKLEKFKKVFQDKVKAQ